MARRGVQVLAAALLASGLVGCGGDDARPLVTGLLDVSGYRLVVEDRPAMRLMRGDDVLLDFDERAFQLGVVDSVSDELNYDPYRLYVEHATYTPLEDLHFLTPTAAHFAAVEPGAAELSLELEYDEGQSASLHIQVGGDGRYALRLVPHGGRTAMMRLAPHADAEEGFYGMGEVFDDVNHRGHVRAMQLEVDGTIESTNNEAHVPVPLLIGTRGWGLFVEDPHPGVFAVAVEDERTIETTFATGVDSEQGLSFHLLAAEHPLDVTRRYYDITGLPKLPARWALGPWVWRDENDDQAQVESDLDAIRDLDLATTGYWIDRPYATAVNTFDFLPSQFPDPPAMFAKMRTLSFRTALWHTPYLDESDAATQTLRSEAEAQGYYPPQTGLSLNGWGRPIDLTNPDAVAWWRDQLASYIALGVEGFKLDYGEDVAPGLFNKRTIWSFSDGSDERTQHSQFQRHYHGTYAELMPEGGGFLLCRGGTYGDQQNGIIIWPGDLDSSFETHREQGADYVAVGGLPASVIAGNSLGPSGFPFFGADTGGYRHCPPDKELFMRWFEQTALSTVMQIGTSCNDVAWEPTAENGFDQELLDRYREYTRLHLRLFPYLWSYAVHMLGDGRPIQRALGLAHPELGVHPNDIYMLGDALLVAPVVERGVTRKTVTFPEGKWMHWLTGERFEGPGEQQVDAPLGRLPLFLRAGQLVPMLRPSIEALDATNEPARVDSYATDPGAVFVRALVDDSASFNLFDGGELGLDVSGNALSVTARSGAELKGAVYELLGAGAPSSVTRGGSAMSAQPDLATLLAAGEGWWHDAATSTLWIALPAGDERADVTF